MVQFSVSIESTHGLTWSLWRQLVSEVEELGFAGLYLTDHFPHGQAALELIVGLTYLAQQTKRIHFSSLVAPLSIRDPRILARQAAALDDLSGGRMILGMGTGWVEQEHQRWGYELGDKATRVARFEEGLQLITSLLRSEEPVTLAGRFFQLEGAQLLPRPQRPGGHAFWSGATARSASCRWWRATPISGMPTTSRSPPFKIGPPCSMTSCARWAAGQARSNARSFCRCCAGATTTRSGSGWVGSTDACPN